VDLLSSLLSALVNQASAYTEAGVVGGRMGNAHPSIAPYEVLSTADGQLALAVGNDRQFGALAQVLERPELAEDPRFTGNEARVANRAELRERLEAALSGGSTADWAARLTQAGVPAGPVNDIAAAFELAGALGLEPVVGLEREDGTAVKLPRNPIRLSRTPVSLPGRAAAPGERDVTGR
jgi:crotonobetainyl-CoA:carnitine CoA-transferase CaiB-like acyl-CoA transferase